MPGFRRILRRVDVGGDGGRRGSSREASWFEFAREIFYLAGADVNRVVPVSSGEYPRPAKRPSYSVLSHGEWSKTSIRPMRDWKTALTAVMPEIISTVKAEG